MSVNMISLDVTRRVASAKTDRASIRGRAGLVVCLGLATVIWAGSAQHSFAAGQKTSPKNAANFIQTLGERTMALFAQTDVPMPEREVRIRGLMREVFAFETIGQFVLSRTWRTATPEQRTEYLTLFNEFLVRTYSRRLGGYGGYGFVIAQTKPLGKRDALVTTVIEQSSGPALKAGWRIRAFGNDYKIVDVMVEGVSMAVTQRSEFGTIIRREGLDKLIEILRAKVNSFSAKSS